MARSAWRGLTIRAKVAAPPGDQNSFDLSAAAQASLPGATVHLVMLLIIARDAAGVDKIGNG